MEQTILEEIDKVKFAIEQMFKDAYTHLHLDGRFSPHKNFTNSLEEWCNKTDRDFRVWQLSMFRLFSLRAKFKYSGARSIVNYVINLDKEKLGLGELITSPVC